MGYKFCFIILYLIQPTREIWRNQLYFFKISKSSTLLGCCSKHEIIKIIERRESRWVISSLCLSQLRERFGECGTSFAKRTSQRTIVTYNICSEEIKSFHVQFLHHVSVQCIYSS